jgi:hypothetical protein
MFYPVAEVRHRIKHHNTLCFEGFASAPWCDDEVIIKKWMFVAGNVVFIDARWRDPSGCLMMPYDVFDSRFASIQYKQRRSDGGMLHVEPTSNSKLLTPQGLSPGTVPYESR